ncbi:MAG: uracil phosphoribosyltransferase, partial [Spirochaetota bacterium]
MYTEVDHPLLKQKLTVLRDSRTGTRDFRMLASEITMLLAYEALKTVSVAEDVVETPIAPCRGKRSSAWSRTRPT